MTIFYSNHYSDLQMTNTNNVIKNAASQYSNVSIMDWAAAAGADGNKYILSDHVHPTDEGKQLFAKIMKEAVDQVSTVGSSSSTGDGKFDAIYSAKNADQYVFNVADYNGTTVAFPIAYATKSNVSGGRGSYTFLSNLPCNHSVGCHYGEGAPAGQAAAFDVV